MHRIVDQINARFIIEDFKIASGVKPKRGGGELIGTAAKRWGSAEQLGGKGERGAGGEKCTGTMTWTAETRIKKQHRT